MATRLKFREKVVACFAAALLVLSTSCDFHLGPPPGRATLAVCPSDQAQSSSCDLWTLGGTVSLGGTFVFLPVAALLCTTSGEMTITASPDTETDVRASGG